MTQSLKEYVENFNEAPLLIDEFAQAALDVKRTPKSAELIDAAKAFLEAQEAFNTALENVGVTIG